MSVAIDDAVNFVVIVLVQYYCEFMHLSPRKLGFTNVLKLYSCFQLIVSYESVLSSKLIVVSSPVPLSFCSYVPENHSWPDKACRVKLGIR